MLGIFPAKWRIVRIDFGNGFFSVSIADGKKSENWAFLSISLSSDNQFNVFRDF